MSNVKEKRSYRKVLNYNQGVEHNFDLTVVMPFYKRIEVFKKVIVSNSKFLQRNGIEVLIALDSGCDEANLIKVLKSYP